MVRNDMQVLILEKTEGQNQKKEQLSESDSQASAI
jgi:hypothetical protein